MEMLLKDPTMDSTKTLIMRVFPTYQWPHMIEMPKTRQILETFQYHTENGAKWPGVPATWKPTPEQEVVAEKAIEEYAYFSPRWQPIDIKGSDFSLWEFDMLAALLVNKPVVPPQPSAAPRPTSITVHYTDGTNKLLPL